MATPNDIEKMRDELIKIMLKALHYTSEGHHRLAELQMDGMQRWLKIMRATFPQETEDTLREVMQKIQGKSDE